MVTTKCLILFLFFKGGRTLLWLSVGWFSRKENYTNMLWQKKRCKPLKKSRWSYVGEYNITWLIIWGEYYFENPPSVEVSVQSNLNAVQLLLNRFCPQRWRGSWLLISQLFSLMCSGLGFLMRKIACFLQGVQVLGLHCLVWFFLKQFLHLSINSTGLLFKK